MARRRKATGGSRDVVVLPETAGSDEQLLVHGSKVASHAAKAQKESRRAARAERKLAHAERKAIGDAATLAAEQAAGETDPVAAPRSRRDAGKAKGKAREKTPDPSGLTGAKVKRYIGIARILVPVLAPIVYQAAGAARARWDQQRARRLGLAPDELSDFSGRGTALYARVHHLAVSTRDLQTRRGDDADVRAFAEDAGTRLSDLESAVRAAEQMPAARRRAAHVAVGGELDRLENRLLTLWGLDGTAGPGSPRAS